MDDYAVCALAHVRILLVPIGSISKRTFDQWAAEIRTIEALRLSDIPPGTRDEKARFMPSPKSRGYIHLNYPSHPPSSSLFDLALFRPSLFPLGVIGIASCSRTDSLSSILAEFNASLKEMFPQDCLYPLARNCFIFEEDDGSTNLNLGDLLPGLVVIPSAMGNKKENIETLLADLCSNILGEFSTIMSNLETPLGNEYLNAALFPKMPSASDMPRPLDDDSRTPLPSFNSQPELTTVNKRQSLLPTRTSSTGPGMMPPSRQSTLGLPARKSGIGAASSHGRLFKVLGDLFLLSGRTEDATIWYTEAVSLFKLQPDTIWHAAASEGQATIALVEAWMASQSTVCAFATRPGQWSDIVDKVETAAGLYAKVTPPTTDNQYHYAHLSFLYVHAVLRHANVLLSVWIARGWGQLALSTMLSPRAAPPAPRGQDAAARTQREKLSSLSGVSRAQVADALSDVHGPWLLHLSHRERIGVLEQLASRYALLGFRRKEVYVLREVVGCIMDLIVCGRAEGDAATFFDGVNGSSPGGSMQSARMQMADVAVRETDRVDGNRSIVALVSYICRVHGVDLDIVKHIDPNNASVDEKHADDEDALEDPSGWAEIQVGIVREALAVAEALPEPSVVAQFAFSALKSLHTVLSDDDQLSLFGSASRALTAARRRGDPRIIEYWSGQPVVSVELVPPHTTRQLVESPVSLLAQRQPVEGSSLLRTTDPFLYNPRKAMTAQGKTLVAEGETLEFLVTLANPYVFDLELQNVSLSTTGVTFTTPHTRVVLAPTSTHTLTLTGTPSRPGLLTIRGLLVQAPGGAPREFLLPLASAEEDERAARRRSAVQCEMGRVKFSGLERKRRSVGASGEGKGGRVRRFLECKVVPVQPAVRIRWSSLAHGALMLYDGERSTIRLTLENVSPLPVDFLRLTFDDSTVGPAQAALAEGELSVFETYETEYALLKRPVFSWDAARHEGRVIRPGQKEVVEVVCAGKVGCTSGVISVAYGYVNRKQATLAQPADVFHTRTLAYPVLVTVYQMLECNAMDILPFSPTAAGEKTGDGDAREGDVRALLGDAEEAGWCLLTVDVRNTYGVPFEVTFGRDQDGKSTPSTTSVVAPGSTARIILPLKKLHLSPPDWDKPIPTLSDRQFVVDKSALSAAEQRAQRQLFWHRERLLSVVHATWREVRGGRSGELSLRRCRMTWPMLEAVRVEGVSVRIGVWRDGGGEEAGRRGEAVSVRGGEFVYVRVEATNMTEDALALTLDLAAEPAEHVLYDGALVDAPLGRVGTGERGTAEVPVCFVACGRFTVDGRVRTVGAAEAVGAARVRVVVEE
ncbi:TRAPP II complex [Vararia minispora EC-137]|uniref:TRAPP II complex n=1 Tax=Vararia minispora EC-137 TaxID=1314806 RepID=A0ACB8QJA1_9AGAM|nr:TRAPP II complex [Vararia minispora EC-137]